MIDVASAIPGAGVMHDWLEYTAPFEFTDSYAVFSLLAVAAAAIDGRVLVNPDTEPTVKTNLFVLLYGPSGARKGGAMWQAVRALSAATPTAPVLPSSFTMESLISHLAEESERHGRCGGLIISDEFSRLIGGAEYQQSNSQFLTEMWDGRPVWTRKTQTHGYEEIQHPYVSLCACSSPDWLENIDPKLLAGGFLRRLLLVVEYGPKRMDRDSAFPRRDRALFDSIVERFGERLAPGAFGPTLMRLDDDAMELMRDWYVGPVKRILHGSAEREGHFASCMQAHALKVGAIIQILEGGDIDTLTSPALRCAMALIERLVPPMFRAYQSLVSTPFARIRAAVVRTISASHRPLTDIEVDQKVIALTGARPKEVVQARASLLYDHTVKRDASGRITID